MRDLVRYVNPAALSQIALHIETGNVFGLPALGLSNQDLNPAALGSISILNALTAVRRNPIAC